MSDELINNKLLDADRGTRNATRRSARYQLRIRSTQQASACVPRLSGLSARQCTKPRQSLELHQGTRRKTQIGGQASRHLVGQLSIRWLLFNVIVRLCTEFPMYGATLFEMAEETIYEFPNLKGMVFDM